jgi:hypothetical protein
VSVSEESEECWVGDLHSQYRGVGWGGGVQLSVRLTPRRQAAL